MPYNRHHKGHRAQDDGWKGSSSAGTGKCQVKTEFTKQNKTKK